MTTTATAAGASACRGGPRWSTELPLIAVVYGLYTAARLAVHRDLDPALDHGLAVLRLETGLHLDPELWLNAQFTAHGLVGVPADFWYASLHYLTTGAVLVWVWLRHPARYRFARTWLVLSTLTGLIGFTLLPTAPPRLLPAGHGFTDTMARYGSYGWWGTDASAPRGLGGLANEYAAMPSLHVGWALWCGVILVRFGRTPPLRLLGVLYPLCTAVVVMGTANHYLLDAVAGAAALGIGYLPAGPALRLGGRRGRRHRAPVPAAAPAPAAEPAPRVASGPARGLGSRPRASRTGHRCPEHPAEVVRPPAVGPRPATVPAAPPERHTVVALAGPPAGRAAVAAAPLRRTARGMRVLPG